MKTVETLCAITGCGLARAARMPDESSGGLSVPSSS